MAEPFIPPPPQFRHTPRTPQQPVIPEPPEESANLGWGAHPQHPGAFPGYSPYIGAGYQPPNLAPTPNANAGRLPSTISAEYLGYPGGVPPPMPMGTTTPWASGWGRQPAGYPTPYPPHHGAWPANHPNPYAPYSSWGMPMNIQPPTPAGATPGYSFLNFDPTWNVPAGPVPAWAGQFGHPPAFPQQNRPEHFHPGRSNAQVGDRVDKFMAGSDYGPVLDPFDVKVLAVQTSINPLLTLLEDTADRPHLKWNMLFRSNDCRLSTDESHVSWSKGRDAPATFPRVNKMTIVSERFPWSVTVNATNRAVGVTCGEVIDQLADDFHRLTSKADYEVLDERRQAEVAQVYRHNRSRELGVPGGTLNDGLRRLDYLVKDIIFGGIECNDPVVLKLLGTVPPCTYVLKCLKQYAFTAEEAKEHEKRQREEERRARQATVEDGEDGEDD